PASASTTVDIRCFTEDESAIRDALRATIAKHDRIDVKELITGFPYGNDCTHHAFQLFKKLAHDLYDISVGTTVSHGSSDARYFAQKEIPVLLINPTGGDYHCDSEWIDLEDLEHYYQVLKQWVSHVAKK
ncbi:MAG: M20/M25/M40 family metallo-hydrolase, partial [Patescibacteria group bacterium]